MMHVTDSDGNRLGDVTLVVTPDDAKRLNKTLSRLDGLDVEGLSIRFDDVNIVMSKEKSSPNVSGRIAGKPKRGVVSLRDRAPMIASKREGMDVVVREDFYLPARMVGSKALIIRRLMGHLELSADNFARLLNVSSSCIYFWIQGNGMNGPNWIMIANMYDIEVPMHSLWRSYMLTKYELGQSKVGGKDEDRFDDKYKLSNKLG